VPLVLTSDFPGTPNEAVSECMRARTDKPRLAWIPPFTDRGEDRFARAKAQFAAHGFREIAYCDIDEAPDHALLSQLTGFDVVYLTGGDPLRFRRNITRVNLGDRLRECLVAGGLVIGASGGALQLTPNISLYRLIDLPIEQVEAERAEYMALDSSAMSYSPI
jgi:peptidase E